MMEIALGGREPGFAGCRYEKQIITRTAYSFGRQTCLAISFLLVQLHCIKYVCFALQDDESSDIPDALPTYTTWLEPYCSDIPPPGLSLIEGRFLFSAGITGYGSLQENLVG